MIKEIMRTALQQQKHRNTYLTIWSWIYTNTNAHNVYYGTMKEICAACQVDYAMLNRAFMLQKQWNTELFEQTIILRKDDAEFTPNYNHFETAKYFHLFGLNISLLRSQYKPIIIVFNDTPYAQLKPAASVSNIVIDHKLDTATTVNGHHKKKSGPKAKETKIIDEQAKKDIDKQLQDACLDVYISFYQRQNGMKPKLNGTDSGAQINALKEMIRYFRTSENYKTDADVITSFDIIFQNWEKYDAYYQKQYKLTQINSNLVNLIGFIKSIPKEQRKSKSAEAAEATKKFSALMLAGAFKEHVDKLGS